MQSRSSLKLLIKEEDKYKVQCHLVSKMVELSLGSASVNCINEYKEELYIFWKYVVVFDCLFFPYNLYITEYIYIDSYIIKITMVLNNYDRYHATKNIILS